MEDIKDNDSVLGCVLKAFAQSVLDTKAFLGSKVSIKIVPKPKTGATWYTATFTRFDQSAQQYVKHQIEGYLNTPEEDTPGLFDDLEKPKEEAPFGRKVMQALAQANAHPDQADPEVRKNIQAMKELGCTKISFAYSPLVTANIKTDTGEELQVSTETIEGDKHTAVTTDGDTVDMHTGEIIGRAAHES